MPERSVSLKPGAEAGPEDAFGVCSGRLGDGNCCVEAKESYIQYRLVGRQHATRDLNMVPHTKRRAMPKHHTYGTISIMSNINTFK